MRLKSLVIHGFKSFADRTKFAFDDGITGIVGPNGCGKSNVVDAIRWCMGEMSAKHLRGRSMQEVIFAGSDSRGPMGMAEVTLTFHNDGNVSPAYGGCGDVAVTRRLHRDGESAYFINKVAVRLRDITDLFLGTGVGTHAYSIIEQGRIGFVVNARPEDRRSLIEEVAGITKFKVRKKVAQRRMESTEQNLERVQDIVTELERQLGSLRRQARKAERYKELRAALRDLDLHLASLDLLRTIAMEKVSAQLCRDLTRNLGDAARGVSAEETALEAQRLKLLESERTLQRQQAISAELEARLAALERDLEHWRQQLHEAQHRREQAGADGEESQQRIDQARREAAALAAEIADLDAQAGDEVAALAAAQSQVVDLQDELAALDEALEVLRRDALQHAQGAIAQRSKVTQLERQRVDLVTRHKQASEEINQLRVGQGAATVRLDELGRSRAESETFLQEGRARAESLRVELRDHQTNVEALESRANALRETLGERRSRLQSLQEIARRLDGFSDGVRTLMGVGRQEGAVIPGIRALVADALDVPAAYERAVEAALGDKLQYLLVDDHAVAVAAIAHLRRTGGGRGGFVPLGPRLPSLRAPVLAPPLVLARDVVRAQEPFAEAAASLLWDVVLAPDLDAAMRVWRDLGQDLGLGAGYRVVTVDGTVLDGGGTLSGGTEDGAGLLANRREIRQLIEVVAQVESAWQETRDACGVRREKRAFCERALEEVGRHLHAAELQSVALGKDHDAVSAELRRIAARLASLGEVLARTSSELENIDAEEAATRQAAETAETGRQDVEWRVAEAQERRQIAAVRLRTHGETLTGLKVHVAAREEKRAACQLGVGRMEQRIVELERRIVRDRAAIEQSAEQVRDLRQRLQEGEALALQTAAETQSRREALALSRAAFEQEREGIAEREQAIRRQRKDSDGQQRALMEAQVELQKLGARRQTIAEQVQERHDVNIFEVVGDYHLLADPGNDAQRRRTELERDIKSLGPINLTAIDACAEVETRCTFLTRQRDDLQAALEALRRAVERIDRVSRQRFREAFDAVNEMFQKVYPRLFRGGVARLELTGEGNLLDAGVEIIAQPPGKKLQNVGLLSGGEKALTATALVFSIFLIKPSPFCILDEVDAPLDEANVGRFNDLLRETAKFSQFIVITHNKNTMQQMDRLYGVTMEEPGMSKTVSVDLQRLEDTQAA